jgi:hypothetical protein
MNSHTTVSNIDLSLCKAKSDGDLDLHDFNHVYIDERNMEYEKILAKKKRAQSQVFRETEKRKSGDSDISAISYPETFGRRTPKPFLYANFTQSSPEFIWSRIKAFDYESETTQNISTTKEDKNFSVQNIARDIKILEEILEDFERSRELFKKGVLDPTTTEKYENAKFKLGFIKAISALYTEFNISDLGYMHSCPIKIGTIPGASIILFSKMVKGKEISSEIINEFNLKWRNPERLNPAIHSLVNIKII